MSLVSKYAAIYILVCSQCVLSMSELFYFVINVGFKSSQELVLFTERLWIMLSILIWNYIISKTLIQGRCNYTHYPTMSKKSNWISYNNKYIYDLLTRMCVLMSRFSFLQLKVITNNAKVISFVFTCWNKCRGHQIKKWQMICNLVVS